MFIKAVRKQDLVKALEAANREFDNNLEFLSFSALDETHHIFDVELRVKDLHGPGHSLSLPASADGEPLLIRMACWHALNALFTQLPDGAAMRIGGVWFTAERRCPLPPWRVTLPNGRHVPMDMLCECRTR